MSRKVDFNTRAFSISDEGPFLAGHEMKWLKKISPCYTGEVANKINRDSRDLARITVRLPSNEKGVKHIDKPFFACRVTGQLFDVETGVSLSAPSCRLLDKPVLA